MDPRPRGRRRLRLLLLQPELPGARGPRPRLGAPPPPPALGRAADAGLRRRRRREGRGGQGRELSRLGGGSGSTTLLGSWAGWGTELPEVAPLPETEDEKGEKVAAESEQDALARAMLATKEGPDGGLPERFYRTMRFADGQQCWNGPPRSLTLRVRCGKATRLSRVTEPSRCEYEAELETPAACDAEAVREAGRAAEGALAAARGVGAEGKDLRDEL